MEERFDFVVIGARLAASRAPPWHTIVLDEGSGQSPAAKPVS
jgi:hypothetical protein